MISQEFAEICVHFQGTRQSGLLCCKAFPAGIPKEWPCMQALTLALVVRLYDIPKQCPNGCRFEISSHMCECLWEDRLFYYPDGNVDKVDGGETKEQFERRLRSYVPPFK